MVFFQEKITWTQELKQFLSPSMAHDPLNSILSIEQDVIAGTSWVVGGFETNQLVLAFVVRIEKNEFGQELVIVCGSSAGHGNLKLCTPEFQRLAQKYQCEYIRIHTALRAVARILKGCQFEVSEVVLRQRVDNGR